MVFKTRVPVVVLIWLISSSQVMAQGGSTARPAVDFCDLLMTETEAVERDEDEEESREWRYDEATSVVLTSRTEIMEALFEEKWDFESLASMPRAELCPSEPSYVVHWARLMGTNDEGDFVVDAEGLLSFRKDGSFEYVYSKRPYTGTWELDGTDMVLNATWLNEGQPVKTPVERVETPVDIVYADGREDSFLEEVYRLGWFRLARLATTKPGEIRDCACPAK